MVCCAVCWHGVLWDLGNKTERVIWKLKECPRDMEKRVGRGDLQTMGMLMREQSRKGGSASCTNADGTWGTE